MKKCPDCGTFTADMTVKCNKCGRYYINPKEIKEKTKDEIFIKDQILKDNEILLENHEVAETEVSFMWIMLITIPMVGLLSSNVLANRMVELSDSETEYRMIIGTIIITTFLFLMYKFSCIHRLEKDTASLSKDIENYKFGTIPTNVMTLGLYSIYWTYYVSKYRLKDLTGKDRTLVYTLISMIPMVSITSLMMIQADVNTYCRQKRLKEYEKRESAN